MNTYRTKYHVEPPRGWLNDPNGLCEINGNYHVYFQYSPDNVNGGLKVWGHYSGKDLFALEYKGEAILADNILDKNGVYSGSAYIENGKIHIFYTGNVKNIEVKERKEIKTRKSNTVYVCSEDGENFSEKLCVLKNEDYPKDYSEHIRDPKVFKENGIYYMVLGGRKKDDKGYVLIYKSCDMIKWEFFKEISTEEKLGYMWECPDLFKVNDKEILSVSPQGVKRGETLFQNIYSSGYFVIDKSLILEDEPLINYKEWDKGFDFYAPQSFLDEKGRRILIGWAGLPDIEDEYQNETTKYGYQHILTFPRVIKYDNVREKVLQEIPEEFSSKHIKRLENNAIVEGNSFDAIVSNINSDDFVGRIGELELLYNNEKFTIEFKDESGCGRKKRVATIEKLNNLRIVMDKSIVEIFINDGEVVFTTRIYPKEDVKLNIQCECENIEIWKI